MTPSVDLSVIICTWNRAASLAEMLASVERCELPASVHWEVLIVDNNSTDDTAAVCRRFVERSPHRYRYLFEKRQGKSYALNTAVENARGGILVFSDDDVTVDKDWLAQTYATFGGHPCIGVGGKIVDVWRTKRPDWLQFDGPYQLMTVVVRFDQGEVPCKLETPPYGANLALRREAFARYGMFRTDVGPTGGKELRGEDTEMGWRLLRAGETLMYAPKAIVFHPVSEERVSRRYFEKWYFAFGESSARLERAPRGTVRYLGVPRYMVRACLENFVRWMLSISATRRFFYKLQFLSSLGRLSEERRLWLQGV